MNIGIPKERRPFEFRVGLSPAGVEILAQKGHTVFVEHEAGAGAGFSDSDYEHAGASLVYSTEEAFGRADLLLKVSRPLQEELDWLQPGSILAGFLHLASARQDKVGILLQKKIAAVAFEQIEAPDGSLPVLRPFSQIGGAMAGQIAARLLQNTWGGKGILMGGVPGVPPAEAVVLGAGVVGTYATQTFLGMGAHVTVIDHTLSTLQRLWDRFPAVRDPAFHASEHRAIGRLCGRGCRGGSRSGRAHAHPCDTPNGPGNAAALRHHGSEHRWRGMCGDFTSHHARTSRLH